MKEKVIDLTKTRKAQTEKIIERDVRGRPGWTATYTEAEQLVTVRDDEGNIIGQEDPFPAGVPADKKLQKRRMKQAIGNILWAYQHEQIQKIRLT